MADNESGNGLLAGLRQLATKNPATEKLMGAGQEFLKAKAQDVVGSAGAKIGEVSKGGGSLGTSALKAGARGVAGKVKDAVSGLTGRGGKSGSGGGGPKMVSIIEDVDVGVPVREAYDQWTQYQEFSQFTKGVTGVDPTDEITTNWRVKVAKSNRSWTATVTEQIPDERIAWTSEGAKATTKGVVTFHPLGDNLTKVLLVLEYYPKGLFEKTGNIWRAQGRRARLDLKHFRRYIMMQGEASDGWRGEIRDGEVVRSHEDAEAEEQAGDETDEAEDTAEGEDTAEDSDQDSDEDEDEDSEYDEDEYDSDEAEHDDSDEDEDEDSEYDEDEADEDEADEDEADEDEADEDEADENSDESEDEEDEEDDRASDASTNGNRRVNGGERRQRQSSRHSRAGSR